MSKTLLPQLPTTRRWGSSVPRPVTSATPRSLAERVPTGAGGRTRAQGARPTTAFLAEETKGTPISQQGSRPKTSLARPKSGTVRPLSGRVFIRRTVKNGWVAKGLDGSRIDLDDGDDEWDANSMDSFFDDDFEEHETEDALKDLLSCNTLGVDSKGHQPDWRAGELAIPKFHCPRCRDHWYGLSALPCDEELARLIREGLWYTGQGDSKNTRKGNKGDGREGTGSRERRGTSYTNLHECPDINSKTTGFATNKLDHKIDFVDPNAAKKNRRITFQLDGDNSDDNMQSGSSSKLLGDWKGRSGTRGAGDEGTCSEGLDSFDLGFQRHKQKNGNTSSSASDLNSGSSSNLLLSKRDTSSKSGSKRVKSGRGRRKRQGKTDDASDISGQNLTGHGASNTEGGAGNLGAGTDSTDGKDHQESDQSGQDKTGRHRSNSLSSSRAGGSQTSLYSNKGGRLGSGKGTVGKGYMRVPSLSNQEWGNPTHALPWASNTASSSRASLAHGTGRHDNSNSEDKDGLEKWAVSVPPIPPSKKNMFSLLDLPPGFELTRAFTYSYY